MRFLGLAFLVLLGLEILSIVLVAKWLGFWITVGLMVLGFFAGSFLLRRNKGLSGMMMAGALLQGGVSVYQMLWPVRIPVAGVLLMIPGFFSSLIALVLLLPFRGKPIANGKSAHFSGTFGQGGFGAAGFQQRRQQDDDDIIEGDFVVREEAKRNSTRRIERRD